MSAGKMAKRIADKELTDRNWDQEEESEDAGTFSVASQDVLKGREIKKAKRRNPGSESEGSGAFKGFKGLFPTSGASFGGFGSEAAAKPLPSLTNGSRTTSLFTSMPAEESKQTFGSLFTNLPMSSAADGISSTAKTNGENPSPTSNSAPNKSVRSSDYNKQLTSLNCSVRDWIMKHVNANPLCDLTPIFKDYEEHLATIEQKYGSSTDSGSESDGSKGTPTIPSFASSKLETKPSFTFTCKESKSEQPAQSSKEKLPQPASLFSSGQKAETSTSGSFSSGTAAGFSFAVGAAGLFGKDSNKSSIGTSSFPLQTASTNKSEDSASGADADEVEEPPKVVVHEVKEDDAFYSKKCKLFYKKENEYKEKGVGTLHLKNLGDQKIQLLIRADTNLGNILLNILVQPSMPCSRTGKNNVVIVCVPNPPIDEKNPTVPATMLIRVKTTEDADDLHKILLEKKGA